MAKIEAAESVSKAKNRAKGKAKPELDETHRRLYSQGYRFVGKNSAVKVCEWCKSSLRGKKACYKGAFYGIKSWRCVQMTPALFNCPHRCKFCWRDFRYLQPKEVEEPDPVDLVIEESIREHNKLLVGFKGNERASKKLYLESREPVHFAISLVGDACLYPHLPELLAGLRKRKISSFVVTTGVIPEMLERMLESKKTVPTQLYITIAAPTKEIYGKTCLPAKKSEYGWKDFLKSLKLMKKFPRSVARLTMTKGLNMIEPEKYAELIKMAKPNFVEVKGFMAIGYARKRLGVEAMPSMEEIREFAHAVAEKSGYKYGAEDKASNVALLWDGKKERMIDFEKP
ncbi:MAG: 4-demethylwyosine synthase TYW1 [archaeon]